MSDILDLNLQYLLNKSYMKINKNVSVDQDVKFYKKRIFDLTKRFFKMEDSDELIMILKEGDIHNAFLNYTHICASYFKMKDLTDTIQEDFPKDILSDILEDNIGTEPESNLYKKLFMKEKCNLDKFVTYTKAKELPIVIPIQREIDLKNPIFKKKGIKFKNFPCENKNEKENDT